MSDTKDVSYAVGMSLGESLLQQNLKSLDATLIAQAIQDTFEGKELKFSPQEANQLIQEFLRAESEKQFAVNKETGEAFLKQNAERSEVSVTPSGLQYEVIVEGSGNKPSAADTVTVHYHGTLIDGTVFDSSVQRNQPATFGLSQVIKGWTEGLQLMNEGSKFRFYIPQDLAYGATPHPGGPIEPYMTLIFDVELLAIS
ncbi:MAG: FKBP-type peptidyl-prolyl cis-trans isomerase [Bacteroidetes bacterium]|nr:MAG: FKBP-type peptidyl-prolyl cis-trans isomerase [Bacteroidota bacterium]TNF00493.1 MAG: FKBP-type peptidyl-prolyl cis-trans isomerase [Bacteroidota bacterium]